MTLIPHDSETRGSTLAERRRLSLRSTLPEHRRPKLDTELELLDWAIRTHFTQPEELALAMIPDRQGLGGSSGARLQRSERL